MALHHAVPYQEGSTTISKGHPHIINHFSSGKTAPEIATAEREQ